ncbi:DUF2795 domain-containing protein [Halomonas daqiaonensis]|uniref:C2H2-type domain-containing protein n=1 Tax=Halomonas daqiaonensis TaxID=650850 RepID=A0A1H7VFY7_9GAMM|nr:DUF2795 domain-containing protein [Halomonas daqiaonensis]SEM08156.1 Protein of unknown function [Halomonas daqiaonensis]
MGQFVCEICGDEFEQKSRYERHMQTSHPRQAVSAADIERALRGVAFPKERSELIEAIDDDNREVRGIVERLPAREYRDAAEVARAFGELRSHQKLPDNQPSKTGGERAMQAPSAARFASLFAGMEFPASRDELKAHARTRASDEEMQTLERFGEHTYDSMAEVTKELARVS